MNQLRDDRLVDGRLAIFVGDAKHVLGEPNTMRVTLFVGHTVQLLVIRLVFILDSLRDPSTKSS